MIKAVIFDMDGVLIDSEPFWEETEAKVFQEIGVPLTQERTRETMGLRVDEVVDYWFDRYPWQEPSKKEVKEKIVEKIIELIKEKGNALSGVRETIQLFAQASIPMGIASSSYMGIIKAVVERLAIGEKIKVIHSAEYEKFGKPHPAVYLTTATKLGVKPEECLVFEDSPNGVLAAKRAGMRCIAVPNPTLKGDDRFNIADMIIDSLQDFRLESANRLEKKSTES